MKKFLIPLMLVLAILVTGCTIDISKNHDRDDNAMDEEERSTDKEKMESVGSTSSKDAPLSIGEVGISSKYNAILDTYQDVDVKLLKIYDDELYQIEKYNEKNPDDQIEVDDDYKAVVLQYEVSLFDFETESFGTSVELDTEITDVNDNSFVVNGVKQVIDVKVLDSDAGITNGSSGKVTIFFQIPKDVTNYLVKLGTNNQKIAYYKV